MARSAPATPGWRRAPRGGLLTHDWADYENPGCSPWTRATRSRTAAGCSRESRDDHALLEAVLADVSGLKS